MSLDDIAEACIGRLAHFSPTELGTLLWAFASRQHVHPPLFQAAMQRMGAILQRLSLQVGACPSISAICGVSGGELGTSVCCSG